MKFGTAINCMDGRTQIPVIEWMKQNFDIDVVDMITEPGPIAIISENVEKEILKSIKYRLWISKDIHKSKVLAIVGHQDCAGNPVSKEEQIKQIKKSINRCHIYSEQMTVVGLWIDEYGKVTKII
ncbi:MAG: hypothetical protein JXL97_16155 [Bacteroidales bacterium]|nr:hypothetical protein [Bacteroidales bacterium]